MATEIAMVSANWLYSRPVTPGRKATGTNTASSTAVVAMIGPVTSRIAATTAATGDNPCSSCRSTFSTTTMASSTTNPIASTMPSMLTVLSEKPRASITASVAISETGMAMAGMTVLRQLCRNRNTTAMTSASASPRVMTTSCIDAETKVVVS